MDSNTEKEINEELDELEDKRNRRGWTQRDADRYNYLREYVGRDEYRTP